MYAIRSYYDLKDSKNYDEDIISIIEKDGKIHIVVFNVLKGTLYDRKYFEFEYSENFFEEFLIQYYSENKPPSEIILSSFPKNFEDESEEYDSDAILEFLSVITSYSIHYTKLYEKYINQLKKAEYILKGNIDSLISSLKEEMGAKSKNLQFEEALLIRDEISAIEHLKTKQNVDRQIV